jgi:hypothetical protein
MVRIGGDGWYAAWCEPVVIAMYRRDRREIEEALRKGWDAIHNGELDGIAADCLGFQLHYLTYQVSNQWKDPGYEETVIPQVLEALSVPSSNKIVDSLRRRLLVQMRITLDRLEIMPLTAEELDDELIHISEEEYSTEFWQYVANWAFKYNYLRYLEQAYEYAILTKHGFNSEWNWRRVEVMWRLLNRKAAVIDIVKLIETAQVVSHVVFIRKYIYPVAEQMGLLSELLVKMLDRREAELTSCTGERLIEVLRPHMDGKESANGKVANAC